MSKLFSYWTEFVIFTVAIIVRAWHLGSMEVAMDEPYTLFRAQQPIPNILALLAENNHPPLFEILVHLWMKIVGLDIVMLRILPLLFSALASVALYRLIATTSDRIGATFFSLTFIFSNQNIYFAQELRAYSLLTFLIFVSFYLLVKWIDSGNLKHWIWWCLVSVLLIYTHYFSVLILAPQVVFIVVHLFKNKENFSLKFLWGIPIFLLLIPQVLTLYYRLNRENPISHWTESPDISALFDNLTKFLNTPLITIAFLLILLSYIFRKRFEFKSILLLVWFPGMYIVQFFVAQFIPIFHDRYSSHIVNGVFVVIPFILSQSNFFVNNLSRLFILTTVLLTSNMQPNHGRKWSEITNLVKEQKSEETCVCICPYWEIYPFTYYYSKEIFTKYDEVEKLLENEKIFQLSSQNFFPDTVRCKRILFVDSGCNLENGSEELKQMKLQQYDFDAFLIEQKVLKLSRFVTE